MVDSIESRRRDNPWIGTGLYLISILTMVLISMIVKSSSSRVPITQILLFRFGLSLLPQLCAALICGGLTQFRTSRLSDHVIRSVAGVGSIGLFFLALALVPLATATALAYVAPIFCVVLSIPLLCERVGFQRWGAVVMGFIGVLVISWPGSAVWGMGGIAAIGSALCGGIVLVYLRKLSDSESALTTSLYYNSFGTVIFVFWVLLSGWTPMQVLDWWLLLALGLFAGLQQFTFANAFRYAEATFLAPFEYVVLVFAGLAGFLFWGELPGTNTWIGSIVIAGAGCFMLYRGHMYKQPST